MKKLAMKTLLFAVLLSCSPTAATGQAEQSQAEQSKVLAGDALLRWSAEDYATARALPMPRSEPQKDVQPPEAPPPSDDIVESPAQAPTVGIEARSRLHRRLHDLEDRVVLAKATLVSPRTRLQPFTSSRLIPKTAVHAFPYTAVGKLFFSKPDGRFVCSGSVVKPRLVLTAAHCVHSGASGDFYEDFVFAPAFLEGDAPLGAWEAAAVTVSQEWLLTGPQVPNRGDWAFLEIRDQDGSKISEVTGRLGLAPHTTVPNHIHMLGYPVAFNGGQEMHQVTTGHGHLNFDNTYLFNSNLTGGSSGGPWVQNFNRPSRGQLRPEDAAERLRVVGVTSFKRRSPDILRVGSSILNRSFRLLLQEACRRRPGNC